MPKNTHSIPGLTFGEWLDAQLKIWLDQPKSSRVKTESEEE